MYSIIIVDYNTIKESVDYIKRFNNSVKAEGDFHFLIIDNYHTSSRQIIKEMKIESDYNVGEYKSKEVLYIYSATICIHILITEKNLGYAKGNNIGIVYASKIWGNDKYLIISNNDIYFQREFSLNEVVRQFQKNDRIAIVGPKVIGIDGKEQSPYKKRNTWDMLFVDYFYIFLSFIFKFDYENKALDYDERSKYCYWVSGCFFVADKKKMLSVRGFDNSTFLYAEEMILSERLKKQGYTMYFYNDEIVIHEGGHTTRNYFGDFEAEERIFRSYLTCLKKYRNVSGIIIWIAKNYLYFLKVAFWIAQRISKYIKSSNKV